MARPSNKPVIFSDRDSIASGGTRDQEPIASRGTRQPEAIKTASSRRPVDTIIHHRNLEFVPVTRDELLEMKEFGWLQQFVFAFGMFFISGALWPLIDFFATGKEKLVSMYIISTIAGLVLLIVWFILFVQKQRRLNKYFPKETKTI